MFCLVAIITFFLPDWMSNEQIGLLEGTEKAREKVQAENKRREEVKWGQDTTCSKCLQL